MSSSDQRQCGLRTVCGRGITLYPDLIKKIRVLIYNGDADSCVPCVGSGEWVSGGWPSSDTRARRRRGTRVKPYASAGKNIVSGYATSYNVANANLTQPSPSSRSSSPATRRRTTRPSRASRGFALPRRRRVVSGALPCRRAPHVERASPVDCTALQRMRRIGRAHSCPRKARILITSAGEVPSRHCCRVRTNHNTSGASRPVRAFSVHSALASPLRAHASYTGV